MTKKVSKKTEALFRFDNELWRAKTPEGVVALGRHVGEDPYYLLQFHDEGGSLTYISESAAVGLTLERAPETVAGLSEVSQE